MPTRAATLALLAVSACATGVPVRTARVAAAGESTLTYNLTFAAFAPARARVNGTPVRGNAASLPHGPLLFASFLLGGDLTISHGVADGVEVGARLSGRRLGLEVRAAVLDERDGRPVSLAVSGEAALPWSLDPWLRVGLEVGRGETTPGVAALHLTYGLERRALVVPDALAEGRRVGAPPPAVITRRRELRLIGVLGLGGVDGGDGGLGAAVLHQVLRAGPVHLRCDACLAPAAVDGWDQRREVSLVGGAVFGG